MNHEKITEDLNRNIFVFESLLKGQTKEEYVWKPAPDKWCLLEIVCHLRDEEIEDFRARTKHVLETPSQALPAIDPPGWVLSRKYMEQNYDKMLDAFLEERKKSIDWLYSLENPQWENAFDHPKFGKLKAKMFLTNWLAHDYLHIRQITKLKFDYLKHITNEKLNYAGDW